MENGLETVISESDSSLSRGEAQRVKLARHYMQNKPIELYDEATSGLNAELEEEIITRIVNQKEKTVIFITHNKNLLSKFDKVYQIRNGQLEEYAYEQSEAY